MSTKSHNQYSYSVLSRPLFTVAQVINLFRLYDQDHEKQEEEDDEIDLEQEQDLSHVDFFDLPRNKSDLLPISC